MTPPTPPTLKTASRFNPWYEISGFGVAVVEASWMVLIFQALNEGAAAANTAAVFAYFVFVFYAGYQLFRFLQGARIVENAVRVLLVLVYVLFSWLGIQLLLQNSAGTRFDPFTTNLRGIGEITKLLPAWLFLLAALLWLYLRGINAGRQGVGTFAVQRYFKLGIVMFMAYSLMAFASVRDLPGLGIFVIFLFATLLAMASARVSILGRLRGGRRSPFSRAWFGNMTAAVAATVAAGFSVAMLATGRFALFYRQLLVNAVLTIITITLSPFLILIGLFAGTPINSAPAPPPTPALPPWEDGGNLLLDFVETSGKQTQIIPPEYRIYYYLGLTALAVLLILSLFWGVRTIRQRREENEVTEYVYQSGDLLSELKRAFQKRRKELQERFFGQGPLARDQQIKAAERIRQIYAEFVHLAASFGRPRDPAKTPLEFAVELQTGWTSASGEIDEITEAYLKVRYGGFPESREEVQAVENAWQSIRNSGLALAKVHEEKLKEAAREQKRKERVQ